MKSLSNSSLRDVVWFAIYGSAKDSPAILMILATRSNYTEGVACQPPDCILCMIRQSPSPGHPSTADEASYRPKHVLRSG